MRRFEFEKLSAFKKVPVVHCTVFIALLTDILGTKIINNCILRRFNYLHDKTWEHNSEPDTKVTHRKTELIMLLQFLGKEKAKCKRKKKCYIPIIGCCLITSWTCMLTYCPATFSAHIKDFIMWISKDLSEISECENSIKYIYSKPSYLSLCLFHCSVL